jgi:hypothetical protein
MPSQETPHPSLEYQLGKPKAYRAYLAPGAPPAPPEVPAKGLEGVAEFEELPGVKKRAIWIVHGMGQQIPFETLDGLATGILRVADQPKGSRPRVRAVMIGDQVLQRVELEALGRDKTLYYLHLYEAYWAPKTEGVASLRDVISFLLDGGLRGILNWKAKFRRAMFGGMERFNIPFRAPVEIGLTLAVLLALTVINAVILAAAAARGKLPVFSAMLIGSNWEQLTALASCMSAVALTLGAVLFLAEMRKPGTLSPLKRNLLCYTSWAGVAVTTFAILTSAGLMGLVTSLRRGTSLLAAMPVRPLQGCATLLILVCALVVGAAMTIRGWLRSVGPPLPGQELPEDELLGHARLGRVLLGILFALSFLFHLGSIFGPLTISVLSGQLPTWLLAVLDWLSSPLWVWPFLITLSAQVRTLMVQYVGDVAIYITPNKLDRFDQIRRAIKELARVSASALYQARAEGDEDFLYEKVAIIGHSLGSVIAYDTLNKLITDDALAGNPLKVAERTCVFETFGSPLDKIAFFFTIQGKDMLRIREQLASVVQPLIQSYPDFRKFPWINVFSRNDIISGRLRFYDLPDCVPPHAKIVQNEPDPDATVALVAHVDYWKSNLVWQRLYEQVTRPSMP